MDSLSSSFKMHDVSVPLYIPSLVSLRNSRLQVILANSILRLVKYASLFSFVLLALGLCYIIGFVVYNLYFHPLAHYPGPFLAKFTNCYAAYHSWKGDIPLDQWRCHQKYGDRVRYAPNKVMFNTVVALNDIYGHGKNVIKGEAYEVALHRAPNTVTARDRREHARKRRVVGQGFSDAALRMYEPAILRHVRILCEILPLGLNNASTVCNEANWSMPQNMARWCDYFTFDIMSEVIFGQAYDTMRSPKYRYVLEAIAESNVRIGSLGHAPELMWQRLDRKLYPKAILGRNLFIAFVDQMMKDVVAKVTNGTSEKTVFSVMMNTKDPETGEKFNLRELGSESTTLVVAGADTTSTVMAGLFFYLSHNPDAYSKVVAEVRATFSSLDDIRMGPLLSSCTYLRACIDETQRMSPPVGTAPWRKVLSGGLKIDEDWIPESVEVGTSIYCLQHKEELVEEPFSFKPERWISTSVGREAVSRVQSVYTPFSIGPRGCVGKSLAMVELMLTFAAVLFEYDFKVAEGTHVGEGHPSGEYGRHRVGEFQLYDHVVAAKDGPLLVFRRRRV